MSSGRHVWHIVGTQLSFAERIILSNTSSLCLPSPNLMPSFRGSTGLWKGTLTFKISGSMQHNCFQCELLLGLLLLIFPVTTSRHFSDWLESYLLGCDCCVSGQGLSHSFLEMKDWRPQNVLLWPFLMSLQFLEILPFSLCFRMCNLNHAQTTSLSSSVPSFPETEDGRN